MRAHYNTALVDFCGKLHPVLAAQCVQDGLETFAAGWCPIYVTVLWPMGYLELYGTTPVSGELGVRRRIGVTHFWAKGFGGVAKERTVG